MKKIPFILIAALVGLALVGCNNERSSTSKETRNIILYSGGKVIGSYTNISTRYRSFGGGFITFYESDGNEISAKSDWVIVHVKH